MYVCSLPLHDCRLPWGFHRHERMFLLDLRWVFRNVRFWLQGGLGVDSLTFTRIATGNLPASELNLQSTTTHGSQGTWHVSSSESSRSRVFHFAKTARVCASAQHDVRAHAWLLVCARSEWRHQCQAPESCVAVRCTMQPMRPNVYNRPAARAHTVCHAQHADGAYD